MPDKDKFIQIKGLNIRYRDEGPADAPALLIMHGWGCNVDTVASIAGATVAAGWRAISIDFPGFGKSDEPDNVWGVEEYTGLTEEFVKKLNIGQVSLLGHSFGGRVGLLMASRNDNISKLILVDAAGLKPKRPLKYYLKVYSFKAAKNLTKLFLPREKAEKAIERMRGKRGSADYNSASPRMRAILSKVVNEDLRHVLSSIKAPTLLIWGHNDTATPIGDARIMEREIKDAGLVDFEGCGHYSFLDNRVQFAAVLKSFLQS